LAVHLGVETRSMPAARKVHEKDVGGEKVDEATEK
jgi:hypothetical protein